MVEHLINVELPYLLLSLIRALRYTDPLAFFFHYQNVPSRNFKSMTF